MICGNLATASETGSALAVSTLTLDGWSRELPYTHIPNNSWSIQDRLYRYRSNTEDTPVVVWSRERERELPCDTHIPHIPRSIQDRLYRYRSNTEDTSSVCCHLHINSIQSSSSSTQRRWMNDASDSLTWVSTLKLPVLDFPLDEPVYGFSGFCKKRT